MNLCRKQIVVISQEIERQKKHENTSDEAYWILHGMRKILSILNISTFFHADPTVKIPEDPGS